MVLICVRPADSLAGLLCCRHHPATASCCTDGGWTWTPCTSAALRSPAGHQKLPMPCGLPKKQHTWPQCHRSADVSLAVQSTPPNDDIAAALMEDDSDILHTSRSEEQAARAASPLQVMLCPFNRCCQQMYPTHLLLALGRLTVKTWDILHTSRSEEQATRAALPPPVMPFSLQLLLLLSGTASTRPAGQADGDTVGCTPAARAQAAHRYHALTGACRFSHLHTCCSVSWWVTAGSCHLTCCLLLLRCRNQSQQLSSPPALESRPSDAASPAVLLLVTLTVPRHCPFQGCLDSEHVPACNRSRIHAAGTTWLLHVR